MEIKYLEKEDYSRWNEFVFRNEKATFFYLSGWIEALEEVFKIENRYLYVEEYGEIIGGCPLFIVNDFLNGCRLISIPVGVYGGILANNPETFLSIHKKILEIGKEVKAKFVEYRFLGEEYELASLEEGVKKDTHKTFIKNLPEKKEDCLAAIPRKARADIRKSIKNGLELVEGDNQIEECYKIYATNQRDLGSPVFSYKWFEKLKNTFKDACVIHLVKKEGIALAGLMSFVFKKTVLPFYGASLGEYKRDHPDGFMYLALQEWAVERGLEYFDFGRSKIGSGAYSFKKNQGFEPQDMNCKVYLVDKNFTYSKEQSKCLDFAKNIWKKVPLSLANRVGPYLYPFVLP